MALFKYLHHWAIQLPDDTICMPILFLFELFFFIITLLLVLLKPKIPYTISNKFFDVLNEISKKPILVILIIALVACLGNAAGNMFVRFPEPVINDEFSRLLAADTFASGKLANPSHLLWEHFQTFHVLQQPTYASKYLPGQGLLLALGQVLGGHPVVGLWIGATLFSVSIYWMIAGIAPRSWGMLGGLIAALNFCVLGYWGQKYWGGYLSATGCSLVYGALFRLSKKSTIPISLVLGVGLVIISLSRPLESLFAIVPGGGYFLYRFIKNKNREWRSFFVRVCLPAVVVVAPGLLWMGYYNYRVTGDAFTMPYMLYKNPSTGTPLFLFSEPKPTPDRELNEFIANAKFHLAKFNSQQNLSGYLTIKSQQFVICLLFYFRFVFLIPLLMIPFMWKKNWTSVALLATIVVWGITFCEYQSFPRKIAPATGLMVLLIVQGLRVLRCSKRHLPGLGNILVFTTLTTFFISILVSFHPFFHNPPWASARYRQEIEKKLTANGENHLIFVKYGKDVFPHFDYVQNKANIDASQLVWARNLDPVKNQKLIEYYSDRQVWTLSVQRYAPKLKPYSSLQD